MPTPAARWQRIAGTFTDRVAGVPEGRWEDPAPCEGWVARDVVRHLVGWFPPFLASGSTLAVPVGPSVDEDPLGAWLPLHEGVRRILEDPDASALTFDHPRAGRHRVDAAIAQFLTGDVLIHTWDLARATGQDERLDPAAVHEMYVGMQPLDAVLRGSGQYGPKVEVADDADEQTRLLAFVGRRP